MAAKLRKPELIALVAEALRTSGWQMLRLSRGHPADVRLIKEGRAIDAWLHIWNLTSGGRSASRPLERRIQPTNIGDAFRAGPGIKTLVLGWSSEAEVFAAFDYGHHNGTIGSSSSLQIDLPALEDAARDGIGVYAKTTGELALGVRPDMLGIYVEQMEILHAAGASAAELEVLRRMAASPLDVDSDEVNSEVSAPRRVAMTVTLRLLRDHRFSERVLAAYGHHCAFCEMQLQLLDAAHILPVKHPDSHDRVTNGVALCSLHHRAYDAAFVTFNGSYDILVSQTVADRLAGARRDGGLIAFTGALRPKLLLPQAKANRPSAFMIRKANELRGWV